MKPRTLLPLILALTLGVHTAFGAELLDRVIAVVNNDPITQSELDMLLRPVYEQYRKELKGEELIIKLNEARRRLLNQLIEDRLVYQMAEEEEIPIDYAEIDQNIEEFKKRFPSETAMEDMMAEQGVTIRDIRERFERQAKIRRLHAREIRSRIVVSPNEIQDYYNNHPEKFTSQERIKIRSITIKKSYEAREKGLADQESMTTIEDIHKRILAGEDFGGLAKQYSEDVQAKNGGMSEWLTQGTMIPVINDVIFALKLGEISGIIETPMGYHLFRVEEKEQGFSRKLEDVRDEIRGTIFQEKAEERFKEWMKELKRDAYISIR